MKKMNFLLTAFFIILLGCDKQEEGKSTSLPPMSDPNDVCSSMDDIVFMKYCYDNFDVNKDGKVSVTEANAVNSINVEGKGVKSLKGIQYFGNLTGLDCYGNQLLTSLDLSKNAALTSLDCSNNQFTSLDLSKNTALTTLSCSNNQLTSLDLTKNTALTHLVCRNNQLTSLNISNNPDFSFLDCSANQLTAKVLNSIFTSLPYTTYGVIFVYNNPGTSDCDKSIVSKKGWQVG